MENYISHRLDVSDSIGSSLEDSCKKLAIEDFKELNPEIDLDNYTITSDIECKLNLYLRE